MFCDYLSYYLETACHIQRFPMHNDEQRSAPLYAEVFTCIFGRVFRQGIKYFTRSCINSEL